MSFIFDFFLNFIIEILASPFLKLVKRYYKRDFQRLFGRDFSDNFFIVYGGMALRPSFNERGESMEWPYYKPGKEGHFFRVSSVVSLTSTKSAKYLSELFGEIGGIAPRLVSDYELQEKLDLSFCSIGGMNNLKTIDVLENEGNIFYDFDLKNTSVSIIVRGEKERFSIDEVYDYGFIIKVVPKSFSNRAWVAIAGLGEWGTSGAAWFLSKRWKEIAKIVNNKPFGLIIKVKKGQDESAEMVYKKVK